MNDQQLQWRKSRKSASNGGCVEVADLPGGGMAVRDSKNPYAEPLRFTAHEWDCFLDGARKGEFNQA